MTFKVILIYIAFWVIVSERSSLESIVIGIVVCTGIGVFNKKYTLVKTYKKGFKNIKFQVKWWSVYGYTLMKGIILSNIHVAKVVLSPKIEISPEVATFTIKLKTDFFRTILANSITLTPGTVTVYMDGNMLTVHCLKREYVDGVIDSKFESILLKIEESIDG